MEPPLQTSTQENTALWSPTTSSPSSSVVPLCPTVVTLFLLPTLYALLFLTSLPGNAVSLWVFVRCITATSPIHIYLSHLSISNLLLCFTTPFLAGYYAWGSIWSQNDVLCKFILHGVTPVLHINIYFSFTILTWVALSRFAVLIQKTHASRPSACITLLPQGFFTRLRRISFATTVCTSLWLLIIMVVVPVIAYYSVIEAGSTNSTALGEDGGLLDVCYNPQVEIGGRVSWTFAVPTFIVFFACFLLVLLSYMTVLRHIRRSRRSTKATTSQSLLGKVLRNIMVIQGVLTVCLLPYHIFKPIFISLTFEQHHQDHSVPSNGPITTNSCHPLSSLIEVKNCLLLLTALRGSSDPVMYFLLDKTFRLQTHSLCKFYRTTAQSVTTTEGHKYPEASRRRSETPTADMSVQSGF